MASATYQKLEQDLHPPLSSHEARVEADRCYFCHDAPCVTACPTGIDIPLFIRQISTGQPKGAARTIFDENILGGMCARVCPTETLCEEACVRNLAEDRPVRIGELQRFATDAQMATEKQPYARAPATGKRIAVVGAGPAGLACAHRLALHGHEVVMFDSLPKAGGLNEYGIAAYKAVDDFAQSEVQWILSIGGIRIEYNHVLGVDITLEQLKRDHDAVFLGLGLGAVNELDIDGHELDGVQDAVAFIAALRQCDDYSTMTIGRRVVVIGGGMTAIDAAVQSKLLGADEVTLAYRRAASKMNASEWEQDLAKREGVVLRDRLKPRRIIAGDGRVNAVEFDRVDDRSGEMELTGETLTIECDHLLSAIGQVFVTGNGLSLDMEAHRLKVDEDLRTSDDAVWAGGDCRAGGQDLTVAAVEDGKRAAESIHRTLSG